MRPSWYVGDHPVWSDDFQSPPSPFQKYGDPSQITGKVMFSLIIPDQNLVKKYPEHTWVQTLLVLGCLFFFVAKGLGILSQQQEGCGHASGSPDFVFFIGIVCTRWMSVQEPSRAPVCQVRAR